MTREQAINYLISSGFTHEQVGEVVRALTYEPARLSVEEVTALAEWTEKLTKASEDAYNKGYADGMKAQEPRKGHWIEYTRVLIPEPFNKWEQAWYCSECGYGNQESDESAWLEWNYCPKCGAKMEVEDGNGKRK